MQTDVEAAEAALRLIWGAVPPDHFVEISVKQGRGWRTLHLPLAEALDVGLRATRDKSRQGFDAYIGACDLTSKPATRPDGRSAGRGGSRLRGTAGALWLDIDCAAPGREGQEYFGSITEAVEGVDEALRQVLGPSAAARCLVIGSGWGVQYWLPLAEQWSAVEASGRVRALVGAVTSATGKKIDRVWDVTRVMRMPGTWNWRGGRGLEAATGVIRFPTTSGYAFTREDLSVLPTPLPVGDGAGGGGGGVRLSRGGGPVLDFETLADQVWSWADVLAPYGWTRADQDSFDLAGSEKEVWTRPNAARGSDRSGVVYLDEPDLLVVYSDSPETGLSAGLRGAGRRGYGAGVGVISRWRAWVDLEHGGDWMRAQDSVMEGDAGALSEAWLAEWEWVDEWMRGMGETAIRMRTGSVDEIEAAHARRRQARETG